MKNILLMVSLAAFVIVISGCAPAGVPQSTELTAAATELIETADIQVSESAGTLQTEGEKTEMDYIWEISDPVDFVMELIGHLEKKSEFGVKIDELSEHERVIYVCLIMDMEVNNGGFNQYFFNSAGNFSGELVAAFESIGAVKTAQICQRALDAFGCEVPADRFARQDLLEELEGTEFDDILDECDNAFYGYEEDLYALYYAYVMAHKEAFT